MAKKIFRAVKGAALGMLVGGPIGAIGGAAGSLVGGKKKKAPVPGPAIVGANESPAAVTTRQEEEKRRKTAMAARSIPLTGSVISPGSTLGG